MGFSLVWPPFHLHAVLSTLTPKMPLVGTVFVSSDRTPFPFLVSLPHPLYPTERRCPCPRSECLRHFFPLPDLSYVLLFPNKILVRTI